MNYIPVDPSAKALIFDMDGTLIDTIHSHYEAWQKACAPYGVSFSLDYFFTLTGRPPIELSKRIVTEYGMRVSPQQLFHEKEAIFLKNMHTVEVIHPVITIVKQFHGLLPLAVGTGSNRPMAIEMLTSTGLFTFFDIVVTADDVTNYKPHPETFLNCADFFKVAPSHCQVFEDGQLGLEAAQAAGMIVTDVKPYYDSPVWN